MTLRIALSITLFALSLSQEMTQEQYFEKKLNTLIEQYQLRSSISDIDQEKLAIELMRHITFEIRQRYPDYNGTSNLYFKKLENYANEISQFIERIDSKNPPQDLIVYARDLQRQIDKSMKSSTINPDKEKLYNQSISFLLLAEKGLDTGDQEQVSDATRKFEALFERNTGYSSSTANKAQKQVTVFDVMKEMQNVEIININIRLAKLVYYQKQLMKKAANEIEKKRLVQDLLSRALFQFNLGQFQSALYLFENQLTVYANPTAEEISIRYAAYSSFYLKYYDKANDYFSKLIQSNKLTDLDAFYLVQIYTAKNNVSGMAQILNLTHNLVPIHDLKNEIYFNMGKYFFDNEDYVNAKLAFEKISSEFQLYLDVIYHLAMINYTTNIEEAKRQFKVVMNSESVDPDLRQQAILKLAYIAYDETKYIDALFWFDEVNPEEFSDYEKVVLGKAWTYYEMEMLRTDSSKTFKESLYYLKYFFERYSETDYLNEAKALLGYIKQKLENYSGAEIEFKHIFESKSYKLLSDTFLSELDSLKRVQNKVVALMEKALMKKNQEAYYKLDDIKYSLDKKIYKLKYMDVSSATVSAPTDLSAIIKQVDEFERLKIKAEERKETALVKRIEENLERLYIIVKKHNLNNSEGIFGYNYFTDHGLARKVSMTEHRNQNYTELAKNSEKQKIEMQNELQKLKQKRKNALSNQNYEDVVNIDLTIYKLNRALSKLDFIKSFSQDKNELKQSANLDKWANYGAYQLTNVQYLQQQKLEQENIESDELINKINALFNQRNVIISEQVKQIESRITLMSRRIARENRIKERENKNEYFEKEFFDKSESEINEDSIRFELERKANLRRDQRLLYQDTTNRSLKKMEIDSAKQEVEDTIAVPDSLNKMYDSNLPANNNEQEPGKKEDDNQFNPTAYRSALSNKNEDKSR